MDHIAKTKPPIGRYGQSGKLHYSWTILGILAIVQIIAQSIGLSTGILVGPLSDPANGFGWGIGPIGACFALYFLTGACFSPVSGWLADRYGTRITMLAGSTLYATSMILMAYINAIWHFALVFGVMLAITQSISMVPLIAAVNVWFKIRLGMAVGILWAAGGIGAAILSTAMGYLLDNFGWTTTFLSIGIIGGGTMLLLNPFVRSNPVDKGIKPYGAKDGDPQEKQWDRSVQKLRLKIFNQHIRRTSEFWNLPLIHLLGCAGHGIVLIYCIPIAMGQGISLTAAAFIIGLINLFSVTTRLITPVVAEHFGGKPSMTVALAIQGLTVLILFWASELWAFYLFGILFGIGFGGEMSAYPIVNRQYFGSGPIGTFYGIEIMGAMLGHSVAAALSGLVIAVTGSFTAILIMSIFFSLVGIIVVRNLASSSKVLIPDWEESLPPHARTESKEISF